MGLHIFGHFFGRFDENDKPIQQQCNPIVPPKTTKLCDRDRGSVLKTVKIFVI